MGANTIKVKIETLTFLRQTAVKGDESLQHLLIVCVLRGMYLLRVIL